MDCHKCELAPSLSPNHVTLVLASIDKWTAHGESLWVLLSANERARADALFFAEKRVQSIVSRGLLRLVLGRTLDVNPADLKFVYGQAGKPAIEPTLNPACIQFNVSHSGGYWLGAFTLGREVGVDIERIREVDDLLALSQPVIAPANISAFLQSNRAQQERLFFEQWTRAEALAKLTGAGIFASTHLQHERTANKNSRAVHSFQPLDGYQAALAVDADEMLHITQLYF